MKIAFSLISTGLGNNGGSRTVILCNETINKIGHESYMVGTVDNFTWFPHRSMVHHIPPGTQAFVATGCGSLGSVLNSGVPLKVWYIRGHETWRMSEAKLSGLYKRGQINIVNSRGLQAKLKSLGAESTVVYQGIDSSWRETGSRRRKGPIRIGCLYGNKKTKRWADFERLAELLGSRYEYIGFGIEKRNDPFLAKYISSPSREALRDLYSSCHIWFAPTVLEGLHNVPMEAALCGCLILCSNNPMNGMIMDYAIKEKTAMVYDTVEEAAGMVREPDWRLIPHMKSYIIKNIGSREHNMERFIKVLEKHLE